VRGIADTGFLVAFAKRRDQYHSWAVSLAKGLTEPLLTCEAVLAETAFHLESSSTALAMVRDGLVVPALDMGKHLGRLVELAARYADRKPDLADLCLIRLSELHRNHPVITTDVADFSVYRRGRNEVIPLIHPLIHPPGRHRRRGVQV
jgi:predicted nucleic acid-binding protein